MSRFFNRQTQCVVEAYKMRELPDCRDVIDRFYVYYSELYDTQTKSGATRVTSALHTIQSQLSRFKKHLIVLGVPKEWCAGLKLLDGDLAILRKENAERLLETSQNLPSIDLDSLLKSARRTLHESFKPPDVLVALALVTGRRWGALLSSITMVKSDKGTGWARITGMCKQRGDNRVIEVPIFADLAVIHTAIVFCRSFLVAKTITDANKYASIIGRACKYVFSGVRKPHDLRKLYVHACYVHRNETNDSIAAVACRVLGHKTLGVSAITYTGGYNTRTTSN